MSEEALIASYGNDYYTNTTVTKDGIFKQYVFDKSITTEYVYVENEFITSYQY